MYMTKDLKALFMEHVDAYANARERDGKAVSAQRTQGTIALTATAREYTEAVRAGYEVVRQANEHRAALEAVASVEAMFNMMIDLTNGRDIKNVECVIAKGA